MCVESYRLVVSSQQRKKGPDENEEKEQNHVNGRIASSLEERCMVKIALIFRPERKVLQICGSPVSVTQHLFSFSVCKHPLKTCTAAGKLFVLGPGPMNLELVFSVPRGRLRPVGFKQEASLVVCGLLSPCKTLRNFLLPPTAECGNPCCQATSAVTHSCSLGSSFYNIAYFLDVLCI